MLCLYLSFIAGPGFGLRHVQIALLFLLLAIGYAMRITLSVAVVAMTDNTTSSNPDVPVSIENLTKMYSYYYIELIQNLFLNILHFLLINLYW